MTARIFLKLIGGGFCLLLVALVTVDYFTTRVARDAYIQTLADQLTGKARLLALDIGGPGTGSASGAGFLGRASRRV